MFQRNLLAFCLFAPLLLQAGEVDRDAQVLAAARAANSVYARHLQKLGQELQRPEVERRVQALTLLGRTLDPAAVPYVMPCLDADVHPAPVVQAACMAAVELDAREAIPQLRRLTTYSGQVATAANSALSSLSGMTRLEYVRETANRDNDPVRASGVTMIGTVKPEDTGEVLAKALDIINESRPHIRRMAAIGLTRLADAAYTRQLTEALTDPDSLVRRYAAEGLVAVNAKASIPNLLLALQANVAAFDILRCLRVLTGGEDFGYNPHANLLEREAAIERAFQWWTVHRKELTGE